MIETLHTSAFFPASGATLAGDFQPQTGITAVVGDNGVGKTFLTIESVRWLLFGKAALRGTALDYKQAEARGSFTIRGARYEISRGKHEWVKDASGETVAKGAEKATEYVTALLGYGLDVFDLCNAATQGQVQKLGDMRAGERKAIIDKVLRLTDAEKAEKDCRAEALGYRREAEALTKALRAPGEEPLLAAAPDDAPLTAARAARRALVQLESKLTTPFPPAAPDGDRPSSAAVAALELYVDEQRMLHGQHRDLTVASQGAAWSADQLDAAEERHRVIQEIEARGPKPVIGQEQIDYDWACHHALDAYTASEEVACPKCNHVFRPTGERPPLPCNPKETLRQQERYLSAWKGHDKRQRPPEGLDLTAQQIATGRAALAAHTQLCALPPLGPDKAGKLADLRRTFHHWEAHDKALVTYADEVARNGTVRAQIDALGYVPSQEDVDALADALRAAEVAYAARQVWEREDAAFKAAQAKIVEASRLAEEFKLGATGIADARATVKALIAPKISRIATELIRDMSMGKLTSVVVDDEMEITVGGQRIETLSGAGKTVANLALRVAMGRALVGHVFPVFLADEIDGDLSVKRRAATLQALVALKEHMSQIILVTHRGAEIADHVIELTG